ncbi:MAG: hypothetical protein EBV77_06495 [Gemmatimonadaceae bacterium]|nr:hypothetical protein [Gemmatimonadaceae bacterium]
MAALLLRRVPTMSNVSSGVSTSRPFSADTIALHAGQESADSATGATSGTNERDAAVSAA